MIVLGYHYPIKAFMLSDFGAANQRNSLSLNPVQARGIEFERGSLGS